VTTTERPVDRGARLGRAVLQELGEQARLARVAAGLSQAEVGRSVRVSRSTVARIERGSGATSVLQLSKVLGVVGLDLWARAYPGGSPHRDAAHARLLARLRALLPEGLDWQTEVPLPGIGERRSWDARTTVQTWVVAIEAETRARDGQELQRRLKLKQRDGGVDRLMLLLADTRGNRLFLRSYGDALAADFPIDGRAALRTLAAGQDPGGNAIIVL
jgi:transcriptional regulator with XRE-family HTH domain